MVVIPHYIKKRLLLVVNIVLVLMIGICTYGMFSPINESVKYSQAARPATHKRAAVKRTIKPANHYAVIYRRNFRQELVESKIPDAPVMSNTQPANINLILLGTIVESGHTYALVRMADGKEKLLEAGQPADGIELMAVTDEIAKFKSGARVFDVKVTKTQPPISPPSPTRSSRAPRRTSRRRRR